LTGQEDDPLAFAACHPWLTALEVAQTNIEARLRLQVLALIALGTTYLTSIDQHIRFIFAL